MPVAQEKLTAALGRRCVEDQLALGAKIALAPRTKLAGELALWASENWVHCDLYCLAQQKLDLPKNFTRSNLSPPDENGAR